MRVFILQKIGLIVLGIFLFCLLLEVALNIGSFVFLTLQGYQNDLLLKQKSTYRILCLGESTTVDGREESYPSHLESILNQRKIGIRFSVLNNGVPGVDSTYILSRLEHNLNKYHLDMVIVMMGINDSGNHMPREIISKSKFMRFFSSFKTYKLIKMVWLRLVTKINAEKIERQKVGNWETEQDNFFKTIYKLKNAIEANPNDDSAYLALGKFYRKYNVNNTEIFNDTFRIDEVANQKNDLSYIGYGCVYLNKNNMLAAESSFLKALELNPRNDFAYIGLGCIYINKNDISAARTSLLRALEINPKNSFAYIELAWLFEEEGKLSVAEELLKKAIEVDPYDDTAYTELGRLVMLREDFDYAQKLFKKARYLYPDHFGSIKGLELIEKKLNNVKSVDNMLKLSRRMKWEYIESYKFQKLIIESKINLAEEAFLKAITINKENSYAYFELSKIYKDKGKITEAEEAVKKARELNPKEFMFYRELGWQFVMKEDFVKAEELFRKATEANPNNDIAWRALVTIAKEREDFDMIEKYYKKADNLSLEYYNPITIANYRKIKDILEKRKIKLVCVQYPVRSIKPLKGIFIGQEDVIFVDNEEIFKEALLKASYNEYFTDMFAGDFGHCTPKGNKLLAENIADTILKEVFNK